VQIHTYRMLRRDKGYTIAELIITMAILALVVAFAAPQFSDFLKRQRVKARSDVLNQVVSEARSNAITNLVNVTMCWNFDDEEHQVGGQTVPGNSIFTFVPASASDDDQQLDLAIREFGEAETLMQDNDDDDCIAFDTQGRLDASSISAGLMQFGVCQDSDGEFDGAVVITVSNTGRSVTSKHAGASVGAGLDCNG